MPPRPCFIRPSACVFYLAAQVFQIYRASFWCRPSPNPSPVGGFVSCQTQIEGLVLNGINNRWRNKVVFPSYPCSGELWVAQIHRLVSLVLKRVRERSFGNFHLLSDALFYQRVDAPCFLSKPCWFFCLLVPPPTSGYVKKKNKKMKALIDLMVVHSHMHEQMQHQAVLEERWGCGGHSKERSHRRGTNLERSQVTSLTER